MDLNVEKSRLWDTDFKSYFECTKVHICSLIL